MKVITTDKRLLRIDAPEWFALEAFKNALERGTSEAAECPIASFHRHGRKLNASSDVFILFDATEEVEPDGTVRWIVEASDLLDEPGLEAVYDAVARTTQELGLYSGVLWITNVGLDTA